MVGELRLCVEGVYIVVPTRRFEAEEESRGQRLDRYVTERLPAFTRSQVERLIGEDRVTVDGKVVKAGYRLRGGESLEIAWYAEATEGPVAQGLPLTIVYEDQALLAVDKAAGMVTHPAPGHRRGTLVNALLAHRPELGSMDRAGIVHRLDRHTSGLLLVAKTEESRRALQSQFRRRQVRKVYLALVGGHLEPQEGRVEAPIGRDPARRQRMAIVAGGRQSTTTYRVRRYYPGHTYLEVHPETGRTHQIRVHLSAVGHPVVGDSVYAPRADTLGLDRLFLHAWRLDFRHPTTSERLELEAAIPGRLEKLLSELELA
jgi:23S rRNA pseudouridine1911/1915/1917 synthase